MQNIFKLVFFVLVAHLFLGCQNQSEQVGRKKEMADTLLAVKPLNDTINVVAVGDIMLGSSFPSKQGLPPDDGQNSFKAVADYLKGDIVFGNLEGCFLDSGTPKKCKDSTAKNCYRFAMPNRYVNHFKNAGFNVLSVANNHVGDFGEIGRKNTARLLDSANINYAGQLTKPSTVFEVNGIKYGFIAFSPNSHTLDLRAIKAAKAKVSSLKELSNIVIVSFHGGGEGARYEHVTRQKELFYNEDRGNVYEFAHAVIDAGADLVLGHGPHVTRAVEVYKNKFIAYSLGNFCTYGMFNLQGANGIAPLLQIKLNTKGDFLYADVVSVKQHKTKRLTVDDSNAAFNKIVYLTNADFKGHQLTLEHNKISPR